MLYYRTCELLDFGFGVFKTLLVVLVNQSLDVLNKCLVSLVINYRSGIVLLCFLQFIYTGFDSLHASVDAFNERLIVVVIIIFVHDCLN